MKHPPPFVNPSLSRTATSAFRFPFLYNFILFALVFLLLSAAPASAQTTFNVSSDSQSGSSCTLRHAITAANTDAASGGCPAGSSGRDIINITGDITLTNHLPSVTSDITFNGVGGNRTLNGSDSYRAFNINTAGISVVINNLTLANNRAPANSAGGAINFPGGDGTASLTLNNVTVRDSSAWYTGSQRNGGGLYCNSSSLRIVNSRFYNNRGNEGGAINIASVCNATITRSAIYNNRARLNGGAIFIAKNAKATISNSSIYGNITGDASGDGRGSALYILGGSGSLIRDIYLNHLTITGNQNSATNDKRATDAAVQIVLSNAKVHLRNSIVYGNNTDATTPGVDCSRTDASRNLISDAASALDSNVGNIIGDGNCGTPSGVFGSGGNPQLPASATSGYFALSQSSPAVDGAACISGLNQDQRGRPRRSGVRCDIGAYEYQYPPPPRRSSPPGGGGPGGSGASGGAVGGIGISPAETCENLAPAVVVSNAGGGTACQRVESAGYGHPDLVAAMPVSVVDLWGEVTAGTEVCFQATGGSVRYVDTGAMPRTIATLTSFSRDGLICATIGGPGQVALIADGSAPVGQAPAAQQAQAAQDAAWQGLGGCMVKTESTLNFRQSPAGERMEFTDPWGNANAGWLPAGVTLTALERSGGWFKVDYYGTQGWVSAAYVTTSGSCG